MKTLVIFDDTNVKSEVIKDVIGDKGFADVVVKKKRLELYYCEIIRELYPDAEWKLVRYLYEFHDLMDKLERKTVDDIRILHCFSNYVITDKEAVLLSYEKLNYIENEYKIVRSKKAAAVMFPNVRLYLRFLAQSCDAESTLEAVKSIEKEVETEGLIDIGTVGSFIQCITGNFDSRYFNSLEGDEYTLVKSSANKKKIKSEYTYYQLLPADMKMWFVMPFDYQEDAEKASYTMERLHMTDLAVKWVHGSVGEKEFEDLLDKYFYFFHLRHKKSVSKEAYDAAADDLYAAKVVKRVEELKRLEQFKKIERLLEADSFADSLDAVLKKYFALKEKIEQKNEYECISVIGHGDPCFANTLYNKTTKTLKFIDPKGALSEEELWTNPYYDVAKLSHSICGRYDFFNNGLFDIKINEDFQCELNIDFDNSNYINIFKTKLEQNGYDYLTVRIYEVSLFISMLPLHIDYPYKVLGFILNAAHILKEIEKDVC